MASYESILKSDYPEVQPVKEKTLPEYYLEKARYYAEQGKDYWLVDGVSGEKRYFKDFDQETRKIASAFYKLGLRNKGDVVIFMIRDLCKSYLLLTGVWRSNGVMRATYEQDDSDTILARLKESRSKFLVCEADAVERCTQVAQQIKEWKVNVITVNRSSSNLPSLQQFLEEDDGAACPELLVSENDPAIILCTSGSTGLPKGAVHTHKSFLYTMRSLESGPYVSHKPNLSATKATHISGCTLGFVKMATGKTSVVVSQLTTDAIFDAIEKYKPGYVFAFPTFLVAMANAHGNGKDFSSVEAIFTAGVSVTPAIRESLSKLPNVKDIVVAYGMTEVLICTSSAVLLEDGKKQALGIRQLPDFSVGKTCPGTSLQIRNPDTMEVLGPNQQGEICVKSPSIFYSYLNNKEATEKSFVDAGYFRTGDIGFFDKQGFVFLVDRLKEIFKYYNDHISPTELENIIGKHPKVAEVCVVGVPDEGGQVPRAFVKVLGSVGDSQAQLCTEIKEFANNKLASYKHLRGGLYIVDELPKGKTGKISRQLVAKMEVS